MSIELHPEARALREALTDRGLGECVLFFVLGSGLGPFADRIQDAEVIEYADLPGMPQSKVAGHAGRFLLGNIAGHRVAVQQGRVHLYEGWSAEEVSRAVRVAAQVGVRGVVLTNAAGGVNADFAPGTLMSIRDHINLQGRTPLTPSETGAGTPYDAALAEALGQAAATAKIELASGVYAANLGPTYETPAEVRFLRSMGADAVGMSTAMEAMAAHASGARVAGISLITNAAAGLSENPLSHEEVMEAGKAAAVRFSDLLEAAVPGWAAILAG